MFLVDTSIFLEILLAQHKAEIGKRFLSVNLGNLCISDFSLHSVGIILFREGKEEYFQLFVNDVMPKTKLLTLPEHLYGELASLKTTINLDFDDLYQFRVAKEFNLQVVTFDSHFSKVSNLISVQLL